MEGQVADGLDLMDVAIDVRDQRDGDQPGPAIHDAFEIAEIHLKVAVRNDAHIEPGLLTGVVIEQAPAVMQVVGDDVAFRFLNAEALNHQVLTGLRAGGEADLRRGGVDQAREHLLHLSHEVTVLKLVTGGIRAVSQGVQVLLHETRRLETQWMFGGSVQVGLLRGPREIRTHGGGTGGSAGGSGSSHGVAIQSRRRMAMSNSQIE